MMTKKGIAVIIVTFNSEKYIEECVVSLKNARVAGYENRIVIIDNNSTDNTVSKIKKIASKNTNVTVIFNKKNIGFAKAINLGIKLALKDSYYLILLNPDTILNKQSINGLIDCSIRNDSGIVGGKTVGIDGAENGSYFRFPTLGVGIYDFTNIRHLDKTDKWHKYFYYLDKKKVQNSETSVDVVTGGYMLLTSKVIKKIGYLDERFFMYLEDVDFCLRAKEVGINVYHTDKVSIVHYSGRSSDNADRIRHSSWMMSRKKYFYKHFSFFENLIIQPLFLLDDVLIGTRKYFKR